MSSHQILASPKKGTDNILLNETYKIAKTEHHTFCQGVKSLLYENGFGYIWENPENAKNNFHKKFKNRLYNQFRQYWQAKCKDSKLIICYIILKGNIQ